MILDLDMDYFMDDIATRILDTFTERLDEDMYGGYVWSEKRVRNFLENNLGLSTNNKIKGRIVSGHNEALHFWSELIDKNMLKPPFEVIHVDSHADLGFGYSSWKYILEELLKYPVPERPKYNYYRDYDGSMKKEAIGDYLLFAIAYQWISKLTYCANPYLPGSDLIYETLKDYHDEMRWYKTFELTIQLTHNPKLERPSTSDTEERIRSYFSKSQTEPEIPLRVIPTVEDVKFNGDFKYLVFAQSPNYTPQSADFILKIIKEYIVEC